MHIPLALLYIVLMVAPEGTSLPTNGESIRNNIHSILNIAQITLVHIRKLNTEVCAAFTSPPVTSLAEICKYLQHLDSELQSPSTELLSQIQADVSSLEGRVRLLASMMDCPVQDRTSSETREHLFPDSQHFLTLAKVQHYLENLHLNKDKLKVC
uniref:Leptin n=1 Tax=Nothobranchius furzeri TaxID=105023 RepID=A0A8C6KR69_NOTFU